MEDIDISININGQDTLLLRIAAQANEASKLADGNANKRLLDNSYDFSKIIADFQAADGDKSKMLATLAKSARPKPARKS